ncbi:ankyrin repeat domain-containing protein [Rickettsiales endosymbiont of Stachyamoeba lipophora]|uniref:ankyrin repeat domain-containing protein n=1 Tax=Rickettsiales endosymbiont of Stachyamoeba lipophora TaxID=2486578 RepID=UPI000F6475A3|nr:ankyrin repeat domain-containing protein [Rickettsiales endosymbiont of Stachyamoeba lipophora]AZL15168.1 ankyrin repeat domain-containing protein [Rickettsiales endosymbiont of Stachyamoeba lipophora]
MPSITSNVDTMQNDLQARLEARDRLKENFLKAISGMIMQDDGTYQRVTGENADNIIIERLTLLLDQGVDINTVDDKIFGPVLHRAVRMNSLRVVQFLIDRGANIEARNNCQSAPLHAAVEDAGTEMVKLLLDKGANIEAKDHFDCTPLHKAVERGIRALDVIKLLLNSGASVNAKDKYRLNTPLHKAIKSNSFSITNLLIDHGADTEAKNSRGQTALDVAVDKNNQEIIDLLLQKGALKTYNYYRTIEKCNIFSANFHHYSTYKNYEFKNLRAIAGAAMTAATVAIGAFLGFGALPILAGLAVGNIALNAANYMLVDQKITPDNHSNQTKCDSVSHYAWNTILPKWVWKVTEPRQTEAQQVR